MRARTITGLIFVLVLASATVWVVTRVHINADLSAFLPSATSGEQRFLVSELKEGVASRLILIELSGDASEVLAEVSRSLARMLAADTAFRYVNNGDATWATRDLDFLRAHRYQLSDRVTPERFAVAGLRASLQARMRELATGSGLITKELLPEDPTGETLHLLQQFVPAVQPLQQHGVWFDPQGTRALLLAETRSAGSDLDGQAAALRALEHAFASARDGTRAVLRQSSPGTMAAESRTLIAADASRLAIISTVLILAILGVVYRSAVVVLLCVVPALAGLVLGVAGVGAVFGGIHAITLGFGATLLGEAVDYPGYLLTQVAPHETARATLERLARTLAMAVLTTVAACVALLLSGFSGLAQLGMLTMIGVLGAGGVTAWVLPYWVPARWHPRPASASATLAAQLTLSPAARIVLAVVLLASLLGLASIRPWWDDDLANMNPLPADLKQRDRELRAALGAPDVRFMLLIEGATREAVLRDCERLRPLLGQSVTNHALDGFELVSDYLPSLAVQRQRRDALPETARLRADFVEAAQGLPLRIEAFEPFFDAVGRARVAAPLTAEDFAGTALALKLDALLRNADARWYVVVPLTGVHGVSEVQAALASARDSAARWIDLQATSRSMMADFRARAMSAFGVGAVLLIAVLALGLRSVVGAGRVAAPVAVALIATAAAMVALSHPLTVFHLIALMLVAGIGTNYALFLYQGGPVSASILRSLGVVSGTTLCAFGTLATAQAPVLRAIGLTVTLGVLLTLAFSLLLKPAHDEGRAA